MKIKKTKTFTKNEVLDLTVSLFATDSNSENKWRGFYNFLSHRELKGEWGEYWKT